MPLYEYRCENCGNQFEVIQKFSDEPLVTHETCGGPVHRLLSAPALQFKGTGWYITDYSKSGKSGKSGEGDNGGGSKKAETPAASSGGSESGTAPTTSTPAKSETKSTSSDKK
jgi:putative FmdB family regulatory protein